MKRKNGLLSELLQALQAARLKRGPAWTGQKKSLLKKISAAPLKAATALRAYHDLLMYFCAFPDDSELHKLAESELRRIAGTIRESRSSGQRLARNLMDSGIAHTDVAHVYTWPITAWLSKSFGSDVELDWEDETVEATLEDLGHSFLPHVEQSSMLTDRMSTRELFELGKGAGDRTVLSWLVDSYRSSAGSGMEYYDLMELRLRWQLDAKIASRTFNRFPRRRLSVGSGRSVVKRDLRKQLAVKLPRPQTLTTAESGHLIDVARATLSVRQRETEAVTYSNIDEVDLFRLDGGIDVAIYGMAPERRLSIDSFFGFVAAKNGVPVAYGGSFVYLHRSDIGLNIFREYRGGESTVLFTQILRAFVQHYDSTEITIDSAQFGYGRSGGIQSGAFWFYYKMGFRPADHDLARLARAEWGRIRTEPGYRTSARTLRRFTASNLVLDLDENSCRSAPVPAMADISLAVTRDAATNFNGNREAQAKWAQRRVRRCLNVGNTAGWPADERQSFLRLCPLIALISDLADWSDAQKRSLVALMRAKGGRKERRFVLMLQRHRKLAHALADLAYSYSPR